MSNENKCWRCLDAPKGTCVIIKNKRKQAEKAKLGVGMNLVAKAVVKNKFWIVEQDGEQVATIQTHPTGVTYVFNEQREQFVSISMLRAKYKISFDKSKAAKKPAITHDVSGYPCDHKPFNVLFNVAKKLPVYTKTDQSKSFFCAGHYLIKFNVSYVHAYCPKLITLNRYDYYGPFHTKQDARDYSKSIKESSV
jgi:hypothetical protein